MTSRPIALQPRRDVWVIVPVFNEAAVIGEVLRSLSEHFPNVVAVDDGSHDASAAEIRATGARLVRHPVNIGMGAAIQTGVQFALLDPDAQYFVTFDGDGQHRAADAVAMVDRLRLSSLDILLGSRFLGSASAIGARRRTLLKSARLFDHMTSGVQLTDAHNGLRAFSRRFARQLKLTHADMAHASEVLEQVAQSGLHYAEHPVTIDYTEYSIAKGQRSINSINIAVDVCFRLLLGGRG
jgi:glycosyltransferase involved in cell wall biosynthesis